MSHGGVLNGCRDSIIQALDLGPDAAHREHFARDGIGARDGRRIRAGVLLRTHGKYGSHAVDEAVGDGGGDDLAAQAMALQPRREAQTHGFFKNTATPESYALSLHDALPV